MSGINKIISLPVFLITGLALLLIACGSNPTGDQPNSGLKQDTIQESQQQNPASDSEDLTNTGNDSADLNNEIQSEDTGESASTGSSAGTEGNTGEVVAEGSSTADISNPGGGGGNDGTITGTVTAPQGVDIYGTLVIACYLQDGDCDEQKSREINITEPAGSSASYSLEGLAAGEYIMIAIKDLNGDDVFDENDGIGFYEPVDPQVIIVRPPAQDINIRMAVMNDVGSGSAESSDNGGTSGGEPVRTDPMPDSLVGYWHYMRGSGIDVNDPALGLWSSSGRIYELKILPTGYYELKTFLSSTLYSKTSSLFEYEVGAVKVSDTELTLHRTDGFQKVRKSDGYYKDTILGTGTTILRWRIGVYEYDKTESLWLTFPPYDTFYDEYRLTRKNNYCELTTYDSSTSTQFNCYDK